MLNVKLWTWPSTWMHIEWEICTAKSVDKWTVREGSNQMFAALAQGMSAKNELTLKARWCMCAIECCKAFEKKQLRMLNLCWNHRVANVQCKTMEKTPEMLCRKFPQRPKIKSLWNVKQSQSALEGIRVSCSAVLGQVKGSRESTWFAKKKQKTHTVRTRTQTISTLRFSNGSNQIWGTIPLQCNTLTEGKG